MKKSKLWMFAAILICSTMAVMAASTKDNMANDVGNEMEQYKETVRARIVCTSTSGSQLRQQPKRSLSLYGFMVEPTPTAEQ